MITIYTQLISIAQSEYQDIVRESKILNKHSLGSAKLRLFLKDNTYLDIWLSPTGKYSYHWEQRAQRGIIYRYDNAPDFPQIKTHPHHLHNGSEDNVQPSQIPIVPPNALRPLLNIIREKCL